MARRFRSWWLPAVGVTAVVVGLAAALVVVLAGRTGAGATGSAARQQQLSRGGERQATGATAAADSGSPTTAHPAPPPRTSPQVPPQPTDGTGLTIVGDSLTYGPRMWVQGALPAAEIRAKGYEGWAWGMAQLPELRAEGKLRPTLAFLLGTNHGLTQADLDSLIAAAPEVHTFVLMTVHVPTDLQQMYGAQTNAVVASAAARHPRVKIKVEDWNAYASARPYLVGPDGIHPTYPQGALSLAELIRATVYDLPVS